MDKLKKILSPGHKTDDEAMYKDSNTSGTSHSPSSASNTDGISGQGSHLHSSTSTDPTTTHGNHSTAAENSRSSAIPSHLARPADDAASTSSIRSGVLGAPESSKPSNTHSADYAAGNTAPGSNFAQRDLPDRTLANEHERSFPLGSNNTSGQSHLGRDAALAGGVGAAGLGAHEATRHNEATGAGIHNTSESNRLPHAHEGHGHGFVGDPCSSGDEPHALGHPSHVSGPHSIPIANVLDPHVPGEFPSETGLDIHPLATSGTSGLSAEHGRHGHEGRGQVPLAGAAGTAALGAHHHEKNHRETPLTGTSGYGDQRFDPTAAHGHQPTDSHSIGYPSSSSHPTGTTENQRHGGQSAAVGTAAGLTGVGAYEASRDHRSGPTETDPASKTVGPHKSNVLNTLDPRVLPEPEKMKDRNTSGPHNSDTYNKLDPKVDSTRRDEPTQHHYGRDAALAGGAGAAGVGAYEASRHTGHNQQDPSTLSTGPHSQTGTSRLANEVDPRAHSDLSNTSQGHHYGRDAALAGGAGTAGVGAYEASRHAGHTGQTQQDPSGLSASRHSDPRAESDLSNTSQGHHYGRDAAVAGGVGAAGLGGYEATKGDHLGTSQHQQPLATPTGAPQDARIFDQTRAVPDQKQVGAGWAADTKAQEKLEKERAKEAEKAHDKAVKHDKSEAKAAEKAHEKVLKHDKDHAKEADKVHDKDEKKHGGILGFLHRDKSPKGTAEERELKEGGNFREADLAAHARHQRELESAAAAGTIGVAGASFEPSVREQQEYADPSSAQRFGTDEKGHNKLHKEPPAKVQRELDERSREQGALGGANTGSAHGNDGIVTEPHTGLPMNVGKYGSGQGGTDGSSNIPGYHQH